MGQDILKLGQGETDFEKVLKAFAEQRAKEKNIAELIKKLTGEKSRIPMSTADIDVQTAGAEKIMRQRRPSLGMGGMPFEAGMSLWRGAMPELTERQQTIYDMPKENIEALETYTPRAKQASEYQAQIDQLLGAGQVPTDAPPITEVPSEPVGGGRGFQYSMSPYKAPDYQAELSSLLAKIQPREPGTLEKVGGLFGGLSEIVGAFDKGNQARGQFPSGWGERMQAQRDKQDALQQTREAKVLDFITTRATAATQAQQHQQGMEIKLMQLQQAYDLAMMKGDVDYAQHLQKMAVGLVKASVGGIEDYPAALGQITGQGEQQPILHSR